ncbi:MAG: response regulator [Gemmatimonadetes bacterium]|nr:response regulator [Gemmatimonadota bacterium]
MSSKPSFGNWMVAVAEAAEVAGAPNLDGASVEQMTKAWTLVRRAAEISQEELAANIAVEAGLAVAKIQDRDPRAEILVPAEVAHRRTVLPLGCTDRDVTVATANPLSQEAKREIEWLSGRKVGFQVAPPDDLQDEIVAAYGSSEGMERVVQGSDGPAEPDGPHVLIVDDEAGQREWFRSVLEGGGFRVSVAKDGDEALATLRADDSVDLVTLDYWMDKMNGLRVLQSIRSGEEIQDTPVIMVTGAGDRRIEMSLFEAGADDFISKPIDPPLFLLRIRAVLRRRAFP